MKKNDNPVWADQVIAAIQKTPAHSLHAPYRDAPLALSDGQRARLDADQHIAEIISGADKDTKMTFVIGGLSRVHTSVLLAGFVDYLTDDHAIILHSVDDASPAAAIAKKEELLILSMHLLRLCGSGYGTEQLELVTHVFVERSPPYALGVYTVKTREIDQRIRALWQRGVVSHLMELGNGGQNARYTNPSFDLAKI